MSPVALPLVAFVAALVPRLIGVVVRADAHSLSNAEALALPIDDPASFLVALQAARLEAVVASAWAVALVTAAAERVAGRSGALAAAALGVLCPLSILAGREAGPGAASECIAASVLLFAVVVAHKPSRPALLASLASIAAAALLMLRAPVVPAGVSGGDLADPVFTPWAEAATNALAPALAAVHHLGYTLPLLGIAGLFAAPAPSFRGGTRALLVIIAILTLGLVGAHEPLRLSLLAPLATVFVLPAAVLIGRAADDRRIGDADKSTPGALPPGRLAALGLFSLAFAGMTPVLLSDVRQGARFPWSLALTHKTLAQTSDEHRRDGAATNEAPETVLYSTTPAPVARLLGRAVLPLPSDDNEVRALLEDSAGDGDRSSDGDAPTRVLLLPVEGGRLHGARAELLPLIESLQFADQEARASRFDLYRFEVRIYRSRR